MCQKKIEIRWLRWANHPRFRAFVVSMLFQLAKNHHATYPLAYCYMQTPMEAQVTMKVEKLSREPLTGGIRT